MKTNSKKGTVHPKFLVLLIIIAALALTIWYFGFYKADIMSSRSCNLGSWHVSSYDISKNQIIISGNGGGSSAGCLGTYDVSTADRGGLGIQDKTFCNSFFGDGSWSNGVCLLNNNNWFANKKVDAVSGSCTLSCTDPSGIRCASGVIYGQPTSSPYSATFDGFSLVLPSPPNSWTPNSCSGSIVIEYKEVQQQTIPPAQQPPQQQNQQSQQTSSTPSAPGNTSGVPPSHWYDFIVNFFNSIINWFHT